MTSINQSKITNPTTGPRINHRRLPTVTLVAGALLALNVVGGLLAVVLHVNTLAEAFGSKAEMAAPWQMLTLTLVGGLSVARWGGRRGVVATVAVGIPCVLALFSISDDEAFRHGLPMATYVYQVVIFAASALALIPCILHVRALRRNVSPIPA